MAGKRQDAKQGQGEAPGRPKRRTRRKTGEIIDRLIDAAVKEFCEHGYTGARTAAIAQRAGVVEPLLFKHFGSKANLFQQAIFRPLDEHFRQFMDRYELEVGKNPRDPDMNREFIGEQQDFLRDHARMFLSLVINESFYSGEFREISSSNGLRDYLDKMAAIVDAQLTAPARIKPALLARVAFASLLACVMFRDWLFTEDVATPEEVRAAVIDFMLEGVSANAGSGFPD